MPTKDETIFGPFTTDREVKGAIEVTLRTWFPTYLALIERHEGLEPRALRVPSLYLYNDDGTLDKRAGDQLPVVAIIFPGSGEVSPTRDGSGIYKAGYVANVAVICSAGGADVQGNTSLLAERYRLAVALILAHKGSLGGFAESTRWKGWSTTDLKPQRGQSQAAGLNVCEVLVKGIAKHGAGLPEPLTEPYEETEPATITEVDVEVEAEGP